jgi:hypothetical protein
MALPTERACCIASAYVINDADAEAALFPTGDFMALNLRDTFTLIFQDKIFLLNPIPCRSSAYRQCQFWRPCADA